MRLQDMKGTRHIKDSMTLEEDLNRRYGLGVNAFWLSHENDERATLLILVNNELASLHYFPPGQHPGFQSLGNVPTLKKAGGFTGFFMNNPDEIQEITNAAVVPFSAALEAAKEFPARDELPKSMNWLEL
jgi:hypothetical protein